MHLLDYILMAGMLLGMLLVGVLFGRLIRTSKDMFSAGGQSPWWVSGLSGFMTMFSANTFVVWGGIAYQHGAVAIFINMSYGIAAILVGISIAAAWQRMGVTTVAEYVGIRFGHSTVQLITWLKGVIGIFSMGATVYAISTIFCALVPLPEGHILADPNTGSLSVTYVSILMGSIVIFYTMVGGLWAVLMTDVIQFIVLTVAVAIVVPIALTRAGGISGIAEASPEGFLSPFSGEYTLLFVIGWVVIHVFVIGGDWQFAQRFICVPTEKDARKSAYLFGALYLISPWLWMLPPLIYRTINPDADHERAYILMCQHVLPIGLLGLMMAAMFSATASMVSSVLNVYAGVFTRDIWFKVFAKNSSEKQLVWAGRVFTLLLGILMLIGALIIPKIGVTRYIIGLTSLTFAPLILPMIWGLYSKYLRQSDVIATVAISFFLVALIKFGFADNGFLTRLGIGGSFKALLDRNVKVSDIAVGNGIPLLSLALFDIYRRIKGEQAEGYHRIQGLIADFKAKPMVVAPSLIPSQVVSGSLAALSLSLFAIGFIAPQDRLTLFIAAAILLVIAIGIYTSAVMWRNRVLRAAQALSHPNGEV